MDDPVANKNDQRPSGASHAAGEHAGKPADALARRRLLKGAMAVAPAVFTLQSGAARAALSNMQCLAHPPEFSPTKHGVHVNQWTDSGETPDWKRDKVYGIKVRNVKGDQTYSLIEIQQYYSYNTQYQDQYGRTWVAVKVGYDWGYVLDGKQYSSWLWQPYSSYHKTYFFKKQKNVERYKVVSVDKQGNYVKSHKKGNPVTVSCWTSFASPKSGGSGGSWWNYWW